LPTQTAIIGTAPSGMSLAHLLRVDGMDAVVLERCGRAFVEVMYVLGC